MNTIQKTTSKKNGFAMLFTVLIVGLILSIALGISNIAFKQKLLSSLANDSQDALYQADAGLECGLYYYTNGEFPVGTAQADARPEIYCGNKILRYDSASSIDDYFVYREANNTPNGPCVSVVFDRTNPNGDSVVDARGYNICSESPRQVERALEVRY